MMTRRQRLGADLMAALVVYLLLVGGTPAGMTIPEIRLATLLLATLLLLGWIVVGIRDPAWRPRSVFLPAIVFVLVAIGISSVFSKVPRLGIEGLAQAAILGSGYLLLVELMRRSVFRSRVIFAAAAVGFVACVAYVFTIVQEWAVFWDLVGRLAVPPLRPDYASLVYFNPAPMLAIAALLTAVVIGAVRPTKRGAGLALIAAVIGSAAALLTGTRAGWLAIAGAFALTALVALRNAATRASANATIRELFASKWARASALAALAVAALAVATLGPGVLRRVDAGGDEVRYSFDLASTRMFASSPLIGIGPGAWPLQRAANTRPGEVDYFVVDAHNVYLQSLAEIGFVGAIGGAVGVLTFVWLVRDGLRSRVASRRRWALIACFSFAYLALHQVFVYFMNIPAVLLAAALPIAVLDASLEGRPRLQWLPRANGLWVACGYLVATGVALAITFAWWTMAPATAASEAARSGDAGEWARADQLAEQARTWDPLLPHYQLLRGLSAWHVGDEGRALSDLGSFAELSDLPEAWTDVAALRLDRGDRVGAKFALERAERLGLQHPAVAVVITDLALRMDDSTTAMRAATAAISVAPSLAADPWWKQDPSRARVYAELMRTVRETVPPEKRWEVELMSGNSNDARVDASQAPAPGIAIDVIDAWSGDREAANRVFARCSEDPLNGPVGWCARVASRLDMGDAASRYRRLAIMLRIDLDTTAELQIAPSLDQPTTAGGIAYKASGTGRTIGLYNLFGPDFPHVVLATQ